MSKTSNKEKCLRMWKELTKKGCRKADLHPKFLLGSGMHKCFACVEAKKRSDKNIYNINICVYCPIKWFDSEYSNCNHFNSPFFKWATEPKDRKKYAQKIVKLIEQTWKE